LPPISAARRSASVDVAFACDSRSRLALFAAQFLEIGPEFAHDTMQFTDLRAEPFEDFVGRLRLTRLMRARFLELASHPFQLRRQAFSRFVQTGGTQVVDGNLEMMGATFDLRGVGAIDSRLARSAGLTWCAGFALVAAAFRLHPSEFVSKSLSFPHEFTGFIVSSRLLEFGGLAFEFRGLGTEGSGSDWLCDRGRQTGGEQGRPEQEQASVKRK